MDFHPSWKKKKKKNSSFDKQEEKYINEKGYTPRYIRCIQGKSKGIAKMRENAKNNSLPQLGPT